MNRLLILAADAADYAVLIEAAELPRLEIVTATDVQQAAGRVCDCNIILGNPGMIVKVLVDARQLGWVQSTWAGVDPLCAADLRRDYVLTGVKDVFGPQMTEYVITYLFGLERRVFTLRENQMKRHWQPLPYRHSREITVGFIGLGSIGRHIARSIRQLGPRVTGLSRSGAACDEVDKVYSHDQIAEFLQEPDYVVMSLPQTPETKGFINVETLRMMKPSAVLMNVGRGSAIVEDDLVEALRNGLIGGAVLDVFEQEPLDKESPFWALPNVFVTAHQAALSFPEDISAIFLENYHRFTSQEPLNYEVDFSAGY
jgi:phosphoglycerate dehydrogenase-like enzyme